MIVGILEPDNFSDDAKNRLKTFGCVKEFNGESLDEFLHDVEVLYIRLHYKIDKAFLQKAPKLKFLCSPTTGHTHIDEAELSHANITLVSLKGQREFLNTIRATPEHTFGLILALLRNYKAAFAQVQSGRWDRDALRGQTLYGKTVGIIGFGRVGSRVAEYCRSFGAKVVFYDIKSIESIKDFRGLPDIYSVLKASSIVVLCASYQNGASPVIGKREIAMMKDKYFINTARGELVDEDALVEFALNGNFAGLALDVLSNEIAMSREAKWARLCDERNVVITPHIAGATVQAMARTECFIVDRLIHAMDKSNEIS